VKYFCTIEPAVHSEDGGFVMRQFSWKGSTSLRGGLFDAKLVQTLWPWQMPICGGGYTPYFYQLSSDQQLVLGCTGIWCVAENGEYGPAIQPIIFFRHTLPGRAMIFGAGAAGTPGFFDSKSIQELMPWLSYMQDVWWSRYVEKEGASVPTIN